MNAVAIKHRRNEISPSRLSGRGFNRPLRAAAAEKERLRLDKTKIW
jgi:hypothetical protein